MSRSTSPSWMGQSCRGCPPCPPSPSGSASTHTSKQTGYNWDRTSPNPGFPLALLGELLAPGTAALTNLSGFQTFLHFDANELCNL